MISANDIIFSFQTKNNYIPSEKKAYYGNPSFHFDIFSELLVYINGYRHALDAIFQSFEKEASQGHIEFQDSIIYPLVFCHRHCMELELKYAAITFCETEEKFKQIVSLGHNLNNLWNSIRPYFSKRADRISYKIDFDAITHYISEMHALDTDSFNYRYPMDKQKLSPTIRKLRMLDVPNMHNKLMSFHDYMITAVHSIANQCDKLPYNEEFESELRYFFEHNADDVLEVLKYEPQYSHKKSDKVWISMSEIPYISPNEDNDFIFSYNVSMQIKKVLLYLYMAKQEIQNTNLATDRDDYIKDIYRILTDHSTNPLFTNDSDITKYFCEKFPAIIKDNQWYCDFLEKIKLI